MTELKIGEIKYLEDDLRIIASRLRVLRVHALSGSRCRPVMRRGRTILKGVPLNDDNFRPISYIGDVPNKLFVCLLYTSPSPRDRQKSRMPSSA